MAKKTVTPNASQREYIQRNCETHNPELLAEETGLDVETTTLLRNQALKAAEAGRIEKMSQLAPGVFAVTESLSQRMDDSVKYMSEEQKKEAEAHRATYLHKIHPDR